jgi:hypothetical protein
MRNRILLFAALFAAVSLGTSCDKIKLPGVTVDNVHAELSFVTNPGPGGDVESSGTNIPLDIKQIMTDNGASGMTLSSATITGVEFKTEDGTNFDAFENASAWISATGQVDKQVARKDNIPNGLMSVMMDVDPTDVMPYVNADQQTFKARAFVSEPIPAARTIKVVLTYKLEFQP